MKDTTLTVIEHGRDDRGQPTIAEKEIDRSELPEYLSALQTAAGNAA